MQNNRDFAFSWLVLSCILNIIRYRGIDTVIKGYLVEEKIANSLCSESSIVIIERFDT